jgi:hypothetical protein
MGFLIVGVLWLILLGWLWRRERQGRSTIPPARDLLAGGLLSLLIAGFFWRTLSDEVYQPADGGDLVSFLFPTYRFAAQQISQGTLPLWNPHLYGGAPFVSDIQAGFLYLPNLLLFLINPQFDYRTLQWLAVGHLYWAALGMYVLLRTLRPAGDQPLTRPAAAFGALAFALSDPLVIHFGNLNLIAVLSWLPWVLAAYTRALAERNWRWAVGAGFLFALGNYAGHAQSSLYIGLALVVITVIGVIGEWRLRDWRLSASANLPVSHSPLSNHPITQSPNLQSSVSTLYSLLITLAVAFLLTAPILLPAIELTRYSARSEYLYQDAVNYSLAPTQALIGLVTPGFFGHGPALHWSLWQRVETPFAGVATLLLAGVGLLLIPAGERRRLWPWLGLALCGLIMALGIYAILHGWLTQLVPGLAQLRAPARALALWTLGLAVLAAAGLDHLTRPFTPSPVRTQRVPGAHGEAPHPFTLHAPLRFGALLLGLLTALLYSTLLLTQADPTAFVRASVAALAVTLAFAFWLTTWALIAARQAGLVSASGLALLLIVVLYLDLSAAGAYTDISPDDPTRGYQHPAIIGFLRGDREPFRIDSATDIAGLWQPNTAALVGLEDVAGVANPLILRHWTELLTTTGGRQSRLYDMLNVRYVVVRDGTPLPEGKFVLAFDAPGELAVYRNQTALPRGWLVHGASVQPDDAAILTALTDPAFDPTEAVVLHAAAAAVAELSPASAEETVTVERNGPNALTVQVQADAPGYLVLSEVWYPGWRATVNGASTPVLRANHALRAVYVPAGTATVELWFAPSLWRWGWVAAGLAGLIGVGLWVSARMGRVKNRTT